MTDNNNEFFNCVAEGSRLITVQEAKEREAKLIEAAYQKASYMSNDDFDITLQDLKEPAQDMLPSEELGIVKEIYNLAGLEELK